MIEQPGEPANPTPCEDGECGECIQCALDFDRWCRQREAADIAAFYDKAKENAK